MDNTEPSGKKTRVESSEFTHHGVCRDCPDEWLGGEKVYYEAELHALVREHTTEVAEVDR